MYDFKYLIDRINKAKIINHPYNHIILENFFSESHFNEILSSPEIISPKVNSDLDLINSLEDNGFKSINFPGSVTDKDNYIDWHSNKKKQNTEKKLNSSTEGFGYVLRLYEENSPILKELKSFFSSTLFLEAIKSRFEINTSVIYDGGIQKYLDGYEISPHPDIRKKAATWMVNINPSNNSENFDMHTLYMKFRSEREYVLKFWENNPDIERAWVPWDWAETVFQQKSNNSIVIFSPNDKTLHAVKANYNHLLTQRTQIYGNLWFPDSNTKYGVKWENLDILSKTYILKDRSDKGQGKRDI